MSRPSFGSFVRDCFEAGEKRFEAQVHEKPGHKGLVMTFWPKEKAGPTKTYRIRGELLLDCTPSSAKK